MNEGISLGTYEHLRQHQEKEAEIIPLTAQVGTQSLNMGTSLPRDTMNSESEDGLDTTMNE